MDERLEAVSELAGLLAPVQAVQGSVIVAADRARDWVEDGALDVEAWLMARCGITRGHAREWVRVAHALEELPALRAVFASGAVSWDQVRPATRFVTPETDEEWAGRLAGVSAAQVERLARCQRPVDDDEGRTAHARRSLHWHPDEGAGGYRYRGFLPAEMAATVNAMLEGLAERAGPEPETGQWAPLPVRCADALHSLCATDEVRTLVDVTVPVDIDAEVLAGERAGNGLVADDLPVSQRSVLRFLCDAEITHTVVDGQGVAIGVSRRQRTLPRWLRRRLTRRDVTCRFPGCTRPIHQFHHIWHWARGGPTNAWNLLGFCRSHVLRPRPPPYERGLRPHRHIERDPRRLDHHGRPRRHRHLHQPPRPHPHQRPPTRLGPHHRPHLRDVAIAPAASRGATNAAPRPSPRDAP